MLKKKLRPLFLYYQVFDIPNLTGKMSHEKTFHVYLEVCSPNIKHWFYIQLAAYSPTEYIFSIKPPKTDMFWKLSDLEAGRQKKKISKKTVLVE